MNIQRGLPQGQRAVAAALYWLAFGGKLGPILGPDARAMAYLDLVLRLDHCLAATGAQGDVLGIVGLHSDHGGLAGGSLADLRRIYGRFGALWRWAMLIRVGGADAGPHALMIDGFSVRPDARGQGVGSALLTAAIAHAQAAGYRQIVLDVASANWRARAFYAAHGFTPQGRRSIWPLGAVFGFSHVIRMGRAV